MKNIKGFIGFLVVASLSLTIIPSGVLAQNSNSALLKDEFVNLSKYKQHKVDTKLKLPNEKVDNISIKKDSNIIQGYILSETGDYAVKMNTSNKEYQYNIICYRRGDANVDNICDVRDLVAAKRKGVYTQVSAQYGADMDGDMEVTEVDYKLMRKLLVDEPLVLPEADEYVNKYVKISKVDLVDNTFSITFTNSSKVWKVGKKSYIEYSYINKDNEVIDTEKISLGAINPSGSVTHKLTIPDGTTNVQMSDLDLDSWSIIVK